ncbi:MAG: HAD family phosphatase [Bryobacteraceae bacterium]|nr:HAD family phosphatase [Bryobacteraceae bacterium]
MTIQAVIFDFGGVLCRFPPRSAFVELGRKAGVEPELFIRTFWGHRIPYDRGEMTPAEYWAAIGRDTGREFTREQVEEFRRIDVGFWSDFDTAMIGWADRTRASGRKIALLSNLPQDLGEHLRGVGDFLRRFDRVTYSYEVGAVKPEASIYRHCLEGLGVEPARALFLDDREDNVRGAEELGIRGFVYGGSRAFRAADFDLPE